MIRSSHIQYLYDPDKVERILAPYPHLQSCVRSYQQQDEKKGAWRSKHFPYARKNYREIYRVFRAQHLRHMQELLPALEKCIEGNFKPSALFTSAAPDFWSVLSTIFLAHWFLGRGFVVKSCDDDRRQNRVFDLTARDSENNFLIEVYSPRAWEGLSDFTEELRLALVHLDCPYDFSFDVNIERVRGEVQQGIPGPNSGVPSNEFDPWDFSEAMKTPDVRFDTIRDILKRVLDNLDAEASSFTLHKDVGGKRTTSRICLTIKNVTNVAGKLPSRGYYETTPLSGYAPEAMFCQVVKQNIIGKLDRGQLPPERPSDGIRVLLIDIARLDFLTNEMQYPIYRELFLDSIARHLADRTGATRQVDLIIFASMNLVPQFVYCCACGANAESEIAAFVGDSKKLQVLTRHDDFLVAGEAV